MQLRKKIRLLYLGLGLSTVSALTAGLSLSSCTSSSTTTPYFPYTSLNYQNSNEIYRYQTSNSSTSLNTNDISLYGKTGYVSIEDIQKRFYDLSEENVKNNLQSEWTNIKNLYNSSNTNTTYEDYLKKISKKIPSFFYGITPSENMKKLADTYNKMNILSTIFSQAKNLANELLIFIAHANFESLINKSPDNLITNFKQQIENNSYAKELIFGNEFVVGEGKNIYQLWPTGFSANVSLENVTTDVTSINDPFPIAQYSDSQNQILLPQKKLKVTNIKLTYSWYHTKRSGGSETNLQNVQKALTKDQKEVLKQLGLTTISSLSYELPIGDMSFSLSPDYYSYEDPFYSGFFDTVYTGLYTVTGLIKNHPTDSCSLKNPYPASMQINLANSSTPINWRGIVNVKNNDASFLKNHIDSQTWNEIQNKNLLTLPYYQSNLSFDQDPTISPYSISAKNANLSNKQILNLLSLFIDPLSDKQTSVYNDINNLNKSNALSVYGLGLLVKNQTIIDIFNNDNYKEFKKELAFGNNNIKAINILKSNKYNETFTNGETALWTLIDLKSIKRGSLISLNHINLYSIKNAK